MAAAQGEAPVAAAAAAAMIPVEIWSLRLGQAYACKLEGRATTKVYAVNLSHAAALQTVLVEKVQKAAWEVEGLEHLGDISYVDRLLTLGIEALLPTVAEDKRSESYLRALWTWSCDLEDAAAGIPGDFFYKVREIGMRVRKFVAASANGNPTEAWLDQKVDEFTASLITMKNSPVFPVDRQLNYMIMIEEELGYVVEDEQQEGEVVVDTLEIFSLKDGLDFSVEVTGKASVRVWGVELSNAAALETLLIKQVANKGWDVPELEQLSNIARFNVLLTLGLNALVPMVGDNPSTTSYLCAFKSWSWDTQSVARAALLEGDFEKVKQLMQKVRKWVSAAHKGRSPELGRKLQHIRASMRELKGSYVYLIACEK